MGKHFTEAEKTIIIRAVSEGVHELDIAEYTNRTKRSICNKIERMGIRYKGRERVRRSLFNDAISEEMRKEELNSFKRKRIDRNISLTWHDKLVMTGAIMAYWNGQMIYMICGKPVSIFEIMNLYNERMKQFN